MNNISKYSIEELKKKHLKAIDFINSFSCYDTDRCCKVAKSNDKIAENATNITISFCINVLKNLHNDIKLKEGSQSAYYKIQELEKLIEK